MLDAIKSSNKCNLAALSLALVLLLGVCAKCPGLGPKQWEREAHVAQTGSAR
jgi:hypothetical protein